MAKIQSFRRIIKEDVEEKYRPLVEKIGTSINQFADDVTSALNNNITIADNLNQFIKDVTFSVDSSGSPNPALSFKSTLTGLCQGFTVIKVENLTSSTVYPTNTPFISFGENNKLITVNNITGLVANNKYKIRIIGFG